jgi:hypothetical protein
VHGLDVAAALPRVSAAGSVCMSQPGGAPQNRSIDQIDYRHIRNSFVDEGLVQAAETQMALTPSEKSGRRRKPGKVAERAKLGQDREAEKVPLQHPLLGLLTCPIAGRIFLQFRAVPLQTPNSAGGYSLWLKSRVSTVYLAGSLFFGKLTTLLDLICARTTIHNPIFMGWQRSGTGLILSALTG